MATIGPNTRGKEAADGITGHKVSLTSHSAIRNGNTFYCLVIHRQAVLRSTLSEKDVQIADLEKRWMKKGKKRYGEELAQLKVERESIKKELKGLNHHSTTMRRFGRQESRTDLYRECQGASREQVWIEAHSSHTPSHVGTSPHTPSHIGTLPPHPNMSAPSRVGTLTCRYPHMLAPSRVGTLTCRYPHVSAPSPHTPSRVGTLTCRYPHMLAPSHVGTLTPHTLTCRHPHV